MFLIDDFHVGEEEVERLVDLVQGACDLQIVLEF
jgi:hypothetical protein